MSNLDFWFDKGKEECYVSWDTEPDEVCPDEKISQEFGFEIMEECFRKYNEWYHSDLEKQEDFRKFYLLITVTLSWPGMGGFPVTKSGLVLKTTRQSVG